MTEVTLCHQRCRNMGCAENNNEAVLKWHFTSINVATQESGLRCERMALHLQSPLFSGERIGIGIQANISHVGPENIRQFRRDQLIMDVVGRTVANRMAKLAQWAVDSVTCIKVALHVDHSNAALLFTHAIH
ncbi:unnamed protein product [Leptosia nina]|uniref:Uncharacterized protein n=1 Tax=Leptosia nina TaxID=320188 RepID=A0AAV1JKD0_9NEOP